MAEGQAGGILRHIRKLIATALALVLGLLAGNAGLPPHRSLGAKPAPAAPAGSPKSAARDKARPTPKSAEQARLDRYGDPLPAGALARLGTVRLRHSYWVHPAIFSGDGKKIISVGRAGGVCVWDAATGRRLFRFSKHPYHLCVALSPDGKLLAYDGDTNAAGGTIPLVDLATGKEVRILQGTYRNGANCLAFAPDGKTLAVGSYTDLHLLDIDSGKEVYKFSWHKDYIHSLAYSPNGLILASASWDKTIGLWDPVTRQELGRLTGHRDEVQQVAFSPDGKLLASAGQDGPVRLWDLWTHKQIRLLGKEKVGAFAAAFSPDGKVLAAGNADGTIALWDPATGQQIRRWQAHAFNVMSLSFSPDGKRLVSGGAWNCARLWDVATGKELHPFAGHRGPVTFLAFSPDGKSLRSAGFDKSLLRWDLATGRLKHSFTWHTDGIDHLALSPDGKTLATWTIRPYGKPPHTLRLWNAVTGKEIRVLGDFPSPSRFIVSQNTAFSPDGRLLAVNDKTGGHPYLGRGYRQGMAPAQGARGPHHISGLCAGR